MSTTQHSSMSYPASTGGLHLGWQGPTNAWGLRSQSPPVVVRVKGDATAQQSRLMNWLHDDSRMPKYRYNAPGNPLGIWNQTNGRDLITAMQGTARGVNDAAGDFVRIDALKQNIDYLNASIAGGRPTHAPSERAIGTLLQNHPSAKHLNPTVDAYLNLSRAGQLQNIELGGRTPPLGIGSFA